MSEMRIAMITRRFWPLVGGAEMVMANLASEFQRQGAKPVLLTAQWDPTWPKQFTHRDVEVQRLPNPERRGWGTFVYMDALSRWLRTKPLLEAPVTLLVRSTVIFIQELRIKSVE